MAEEFLDFAQILRCLRAIGLNGLFGCLHLPRNLLKKVLFCSALDSTVNSLLILIRLEEGRQDFSTPSQATGVSFALPCMSISITETMMRRGWH